MTHVAIIFLKTIQAMSVMLQVVIKIVVSMTFTVLRLYNACEMLSDSTVTVRCHLFVFLVCLHHYVTILLFDSFIKHTCALCTLVLLSSLDMSYG